MTLPTLPAETVQISPEALEIANCYLSNPSADVVAAALGVGRDTGTMILGRPEVKAYVNHIFMETGYNNRFKLRALMDSLIQKKLEDLSEAGIGSSKDIIDILAASHKFSMEHLDKEIKLKKIAASAPQVNVQINNDGSNYARLIEQLLTDKDIST